MGLGAGVVCALLNAVLVLKRTPSQAAVRIIFRPRDRSVIHDRRYFPSAIRTLTLLALTLTATVVRSVEQDIVDEASSASM